MTESGGISTQNHGLTGAIAPKKPALQPIQGLIAEIPLNGTSALWKIGQATGWGVWQLANANGIKNPDRIWAGQKLWIPCH